jgi:hypothetical protein
MFEDPSDPEEAPATYENLELRRVAEVLVKLDPAFVFFGKRDPERRRPTEISTPRTIIRKSLSLLFVRSLDIKTRSYIRILPLIMI